jgi:NAD(P)-dependent dehydrogenase (short-subunit alcohol dehydrogenase family)
MARTWFITGAGGPSGTAFARHALRRGESVVAAGPAPDLPVNGTGPVLRVPLHGADGIASAVAAAEERFGRIDVLVHAGGTGLIGAAEEVGDDDFRTLIEANLIGPAALTRAVLSGMRARRVGAVVVLSSAAGQMSAPGFGALSASMAALEGWTEALAQEIAPFGLRAMIAVQGGLAPGGGAVPRAVPGVEAYRHVTGPARALASAPDPDPGWTAMAAAVDRALAADCAPLRLVLDGPATDALRDHAEGLLAELAHAPAHRAVA